MSVIKLYLIFTDFQFAIQLYDEIIQKGIDVCLKRILLIGTYLQ